MSISIYTDGSSFRNGKSGAAFIIKDDFNVHESILCQKDGNSGEMEVRAVIEALRALRGEVADITIYSDYKLVVEALNGRLSCWFSNGWKKENGNKVPFCDLFKELFLVLESFSGGVKGHWVKAHSGIEMNVRANYLAKQCAIRQKSISSRPIYSLFS